MTFDAIIVGSGPSGTFAAYGLRGKRVLVLDVGLRPPASADQFKGRLLTLRRERDSLSSELLGERFESLHNLSRDYLSPKLKAPFMRYVVGGEELSPVRARGFFSVVSHAMGGLANAWGAGVYPFVDRELQSFPFRLAELWPHYEAVADEIGISGAEDDLRPWFPAPRTLLPPLEPTPLSARLLRNYERRRAFFNGRGIHIGRARLAVLSRDHAGRGACGYDGLEFFKPRLEAVYNPAFTLERLIAGGQVEYARNRLATRFVETAGGVEVTARNLQTNATETHTARALVLAAGTLNTTRLVLSSNDDRTARLPLLDNPISYIPFVHPAFLGAAPAPKVFSAAQLNLVFERAGAAEPLQATFYGVDGPLRSDYLLNFPLTLRGNVAAAKYLSPAMAIVQLFYPDEPSPSNRIWLEQDGALGIDYQAKPRTGAERELIAALLRAGFLSHESLCQFPTAGNSFHYAGTLPMAEKPSAYQTDSSGRLHGTRAVFVADGANFPSLPAKNLTFTLMANAHRIGQLLAKELG